MAVWYTEAIERMWWGKPMPWKYLRMTRRRTRDRSHVAGRGKTDKQRFCLNRCIFVKSAAANAAADCLFQILYFCIFSEVGQNIADKGGNQENRIHC